MLPGKLRFYMPYVYDRRKLKNGKEKEIKIIKESIDVDVDLEGPGGEPLPIRLHFSDRTRKAHLKIRHHEDVEKIISRLRETHPMPKTPKTHNIKIHKFSYNGFGCIVHKGYANYTITGFMKWTVDPGVGVFACSDGQERMIPTCVFETRTLHLPKQPRTGVIFGMPLKA